MYAMSVKKLNQSQSSSLASEGPMNREGSISERLDESADLPEIGRSPPAASAASIRLADFSMEKAELLGNAADFLEIKAQQFSGLAQIWQLF